MSVKEPSERPSSELSTQNQVEVQKLRAFDDPSLPVDKRLTLLVERLIVDAIQRQDEGLTKVGVSSLASSLNHVTCTPSLLSCLPYAACATECVLRDARRRACAMCPCLSHWAPAGLACCHMSVHCSRQSCDLTWVLPAWPVSRWFAQKTVKEMLRKVVGAQIVDLKNEYISAEVDRIVASDVASLVAKYMSAEMQGRRV